MGFGWLNFGSLLLGLAGWLVPLRCMGKLAKGGDADPPRSLAVSLSCCAVALWFQLLYDAHLARIEDVSAWLDTSGAVAKVAGFLLVTTLALNGALYWVGRSSAADKG